jgi:hypothetical protein
MWSRVCSLRRRDGSHAPFAVWLFAAVAAHGVLFALFRGSSSSNGAPSSPAARPQEYWDLSLESFAEPAPAPNEPVALHARSSFRPVPHARQYPDDREPTEQSGGAAEPFPPASSNEPRTNAPPAAGEARLSLEQLGAGLTGNAFLRTPVDAPHAPSAEERLEQSMREEIVASDVAAGRGRSGPLVAALRDAVYHVAPRANGSAVFAGTVDGAGVIVALEPVSVSSGFGDWQRVANRAVAALSRRRLRIPAGASGLRVRVKVTSQTKLPSGHDPGLAISALRIPLKKGEGKNSTRVGILEPVLGVTTQENQNPGGGDPLQLPTLKAGIDIFSLAGDPVDIGADARRVVHVELLEEKPM